MAETKEIYKRYIFEGNCPCCFPYWDYDVPVSDIWQWQDELRAWAMYDEILKEEGDD